MRRDALARVTSSNVIVTKKVVQQARDAYLNGGDVMDTTIAVIGAMRRDAPARVTSSNVIVTKKVVHQNGDAYLNRKDVMK